MTLTGAMMSTHFPPVTEMCNLVSSVTSSSSDTEGRKGMKRRRRRRRRKKWGEDKGHVFDQIVTGLFN